MKKIIVYFLVASVFFTAILFARSIMYGISIGDQVETIARAGEKWANECTWLP